MVFDSFVPLKGVPFLFVCGLARGSGQEKMLGAEGGSPVLASRILRAGSFPLAKRRDIGTSFIVSSLVNFLSTAGDATTRSN